MERKAGIKSGKWRISIMAEIIKESMVSKANSRLFSLHQV